MEELEFILPESSSQHYSSQGKRRREESLYNDRTPEVELWVDRYAPKVESDLCVRQDKIKDVKDAINCSSIGNQQQPIKLLLLSGPTGCGKSTLIRVLEKTMPLELVEWINPINEYDQHNYVNTMTLFRQFLTSSIRRSIMQKEKQDMKKVIFIDDIPDLTTDEVKRTFHASLKSSVESSIPCLIILVVSDVWMESTFSRRNYDDKLNNTIDIIPRDLEDDKRVKQIRFKPVTTTNMKKILKKIMSNEQTRLSDSQLVDLIEKSEGDIRAAINNLQFYATPNSNLLGKGQKKAKISSVKAFDERTGPLDLFHAVGKVLYAKRNKDDSFESKPEHILNKIPVDNDLFINYLHQNCLNFFEDIESCSRSLEYISDADVIRSNYDWQENMPSTYRNLVTMTGIMIKPKTTCSYNFYSFSKPKLVDVQNALLKYKNEHYYQEVLQSATLRAQSLQSDEDKEMQIDPIQDFSEDEFDDIYGDGSDLALFMNY
ncbi:Rad17 cell cycle checkpoint protein-domain-containing protein [Cokeromyces recurvatus]|uniref:Rad17 cell cycle checkpoint protein-domain-containing protein n=1 Tax=Cokeromyces recurvatus TaxID=90255 RepID=UPI00221EB1FD|nr:Rad17 cell cycle checkpoint protein-domain-containing protein [Cokeromyces recurvatus]KAI7902025.1 Rad17 cell cycle checkpoint protein-domain-containing protein [Cokeromyces recurvatus]